MTAEWTRDGLLGYISSWSAVARCRQHEGEDPLPAFVDELAEVWPDPTEIREIRWPIYMLLGRI